MNPSQTIALVESLDYEGHGVARVDGKTIFIDEALPYERVIYRSYRKKPTFENASTEEILKESYIRTTPKCPHYAVCGGCSMQHVDFSAQVAIKQRVLEDSLQHIGKVSAECILPPIYGPTWGYRHRARLSARLVVKKGSVLVGFHEKRSSFIVDMSQCEILPAHISALIVPLREMIATLSINDRMPQIELAVGADVDVLVLRNMDPINTHDETILRTFSDTHSGKRPLQIWLQPKGPETSYPFYPLTAPKLSYRLAEFNLEMPYNPTEFTQVNPQINAIMVARAIQLLQPQPDERIADMFCGIGNFTLPIARSGALVHGMEGSEALVRRAEENAKYNGLENRVSYQLANLFEVTEQSLAALGRFDKMLIDPPRDGAMQLVKAFNEDTSPKRLVYVSCNPATLARDANILVQTKGYTLRSAGIINMFPHTTHVESIALFEKTGPGLTHAELEQIEAEEQARRAAGRAAKKEREAKKAAEAAQLAEERAAIKATRHQYYLDNKEYYDSRSAAQLEVQKQQAAQNPDKPKKAKRSRRRAR